MARVLLDQVTKVYPGEVRAVDRVDLSIADQEFVVLVGPSGCGKTTTLRMIAGLEDISSGLIHIGDRVVNDVPPKNRDIAMVFQNYALYPNMTVYKNMAFGLKLRGMPRKQIEERVRQVARTLEIEHLLDRRPKALSGGQRQRVALGRAIVREPAAFLFDEPLSNLDAKLRVTTRAELKRLHQRLRTTTVYVTHDQEEAMTLGDRIVVMRDGKVQQADTPLRTYNQPANRFVAGFIGVPPMNFFDGVVRAEGGKLTFTQVASAVRAGFENAALTHENAGFSLSIPDRYAAILAGRIGEPVVLGIRPEHLHLSPRPAEKVDAGGEHAKMRLVVNVVEPLGNAMDVSMANKLQDQIVGRFEAQEGLESGAVVDVFVDTRKMHFFEPGDAGLNLSLEPVAPGRENSHALA